VTVYKNKTVICRRSLNLWPWWERICCEPSAYYFDAEL